MKRAAPKRLLRRKLGNPVTKEERISLNRKVSHELGGGVFWSVSLKDNFSSDLRGLLSQNGIPISDDNFARLADDSRYAISIVKTKDISRKELREKLISIRFVLKAICAFDGNEKDYHVEKIIEIGYCSKHGCSKINYLDIGVKGKFRELFSDKTSGFASDLAAGIDRILPGVSPSGRQEKAMRKSAAQRFGMAWANFVGVRPSLTIPTDKTDIPGSFAEYVRLCLRQLPENLAADIETDDFIRQATQAAQRILDVPVGNRAKGAK